MTPASHAPSDQPVSARGTRGAREADGGRGFVQTVRSRITALLAWWKDTRPGRALTHYGATNGALLCGGIAYSALFSLFAALAIGYTIFMSVLGGNEELRNAAIQQVNEAIPGLIDQGQGGVLNPDDLLLSTGLSLTSIIAAVVLLYSAISCVASLRSAVRVMFSLPGNGANLVFTKLAELFAFVLIVVGIIVSAASSVGVTTVGTSVLEAVDLPAEDARGLLTAVGLLVGVVVDALVVMLIVTVLAQARPRRRDLVLGALAAAVAFGALRYLGTSIIAGSASRNALLASFAVIVTVLLLVNFIARVLLMVCAWMADPPRPPTDDELSEHADRERRRKLEHLARQGAGSGKPWSPVVRGVRLGRAAPVRKRA